MFIGSSPTGDVTLNGTGKALDLTNGSFGGGSGINGVATTSSATHGIQLITVGGTVSFGSTAVSNSTNQGIFVNQSSADINFGNTTIATTGGSTECLRLEANTGGTRTFGTLGISGCTAQGITVSGGGNLNVTGTTTIGAVGSVSVLVANTTAGTTTTFAALTKTGAGTVGVSISGAAGATTFGTTSITGPHTAEGILIGTTTGNVTFGDTTVTGGTDGVSFNNNSAGLRQFGAMQISGGSGNAFKHAASGGNVTATGPSDFSSTGTAISVNAPGATNVISFPQAATAASTGSGNAGVNWVGTAGAQLNFGNSLQITTNAGTGLNATTGGTIAIALASAPINGTTQAAPAYRRQRSYAQC